MKESGNTLVDVSKQYIMVSVDGKENDSIGVCPHHCVSSNIVADLPVGGISTLKDLTTFFTTIFVNLSQRFRTHFSQNCDRALGVSSAATTSLHKACSLKPAFWETCEGRLTKLCLDSNFGTV